MKEATPVDEKGEDGDEGAHDGVGFQPAKKKSALINFVLHQCRTVRHELNRYPTKSFLTL